MSLSTSYYIVSGSYDHFILGYKLEVSVGEDPEDGGPLTQYDMKQLFAYESHEGCIKSVAIQDHMLASGSTDERVRLYNMQKLSEIGELTQHEGDVRTLQFHGTKVLLSGGEDGRLCIWKSGVEWSCVDLKGHRKGGFNSISIHPTGKIALSVGNDNYLQLWDLIKGRCAHKTKIPAAADQIQWSPNGLKYAILTRDRIDVYGADAAEILHSFEKEGEVFLCMSWLSDDQIVSGGEDKSVYLWDANTGELEKQIRGHTNRIRGISVVPRKHHPLIIEQLTESGSPVPDPVPLVITASSDGTIRVWRVDQDQADGSEGMCVAVEYAGARLTCLAAGVRVLPKGEGSGKRKGKGEKRVRDSVSVEEAEEGAEEEEEEVKIETKQKKKKENKVKGKGKGKK